MSDDKARSEFESWALKDFGLRPGHFVKDSDGDYVNYPTQCYFQVWQASRQSIEIELPPLSGMNSSFVADGIQVTREHNRYNAAVKDCRAAIKAAGLKVTS